MLTTKQKFRTIKMSDSTQAFKNQNILMYIPPCYLTVVRRVFNSEDKKMGGRKWTEKEINFLKSNYKTMSIKDLSKALKRTEGAILSYRTHKLNIRKYNLNEYFINKPVAMIRAYKLNGLSKDILIDIEDLELVKKHQWYITKIGNTFYAYTTINKKSKSMHKYITGYDFVDHIDGNGINNRRHNLRESNYLKNSQNLNASKGVIPVVGISKSTAGGYNYWRVSAATRIGGKHRYLFDKTFPYNENGLEEAKSIIKFVRACVFEYSSEAMIICKEDIPKWIVEHVERRKLKCQN